MFFKSFITATVVLGASALAPAAIAQEADTGTVTVLHGVPGLTVDVYANGDLLLPDFEPGDQFGPADLPAGDYDIAIRAAGDDPSADPAIEGSATLPAGANASIIAHLTADGAPTLSVFVNDVSGLDARQARVTVRHTAAFGAVDVLAAGAPIFEGVTNPNEGTIEVPEGTYPVEVTAAGDPETVAFSGDLAVESGTAYFVHAIGDPLAETFSLLIQTIDGLETEVKGETEQDPDLATTGLGIAPLAFIAIGLLGLGVIMTRVRRLHA